MSDGDLIVKQRDPNLKVYCGYTIIDIAGGGFGIHTFSIILPQRRIKMKSLFWDYKLRDNVTAFPIPIQTNTVFDILLSTGYATGKFAKDFQTTAGGGFSSTGYSFYTFQPVQLHFDSFFAANNVDFQVAYHNYGVNNINLYYSLICEVEDRIQYLE